MNAGHPEPALRWSRLATSPLRLLPDFIVIGARCSGTTSLYAYLRAHPAVLWACRKEVHFFAGKYERGTRWYRAHFPLAWQRLTRGHLGHRAVTGEASPAYLYNPVVPARVRSVCPRARLLVLLRNPVDRAFSHYHQLVNEGLEKLSFAEAVDRELHVLEQHGWKGAARGTAGGKTPEVRPYIGRGLYAEQLAHWYEHFPRDRFLTMQSEAFFRSPADHMERVFAFLGLPPRQTDRYRQHHAGRYDEEMDPQVRARLERFFAPRNARLYALLQTRYDWDP
jgi:hypothetical protein